VSTQYVLRANSTATWGCTDKKGTVSPVNRVTVYAVPVEKWAAYTSGKNGNVSATMSVGPIPAPAGWTCSGDMKAVLVSVIYGAPTRLSGPALADFTNGLMVTIPDQSAVFYP
jgi:hypothetical protein